MHCDSCPVDCKVYVGNLGNNGNKTKLERVFGYYGPPRSVCVAQNPPSFAFVEFEDPRHAADAVRELDGRTLCGCPVRVELSNSEERSQNCGPPPPPQEEFSAADPQEREAFPEAGPGHFLEIGKEKGLCLVREITSRLDPSLGLIVDLGQMKGSRRPVCKSGVQEITSSDRSMYRKVKFCLRLHKLGAFLRCFSCSDLFCLLEQ